MYEKEHKKCRESIARGDINGDEGPEGSREVKEFIDLGFGIIQFPSFILCDHL